jgi:hypothetical protein
MAEIEIVGKNFGFRVKDKITLKLGIKSVTMNVTGIDPNEFDFPVKAKLPNGKITMIHRQKPASHQYKYYADENFHAYINAL